MIPHVSRASALALLLAAAPCLAGQAAQLPPGAIVQPLTEGPAAALSRHLHNLSEAPRDLGSLLGAGRAALDLGDPQAALTFFARAEEAAPRDGRAKAGMGAAFVQLEQPQDALRLFGEAAALGIPPASFAADRGLAYDLSGDQRSAQADYALALRAGPDVEATRRLALSRAITGEREAALTLLADQVARQDRAAWRARALVLALTGDQAGAERIVAAAMPVQSHAMRPFLARLPGLTAAQKAHAVHFGTIPGPAAPPVRIADGSPQPRVVQTAAIPPVSSAPAAPAAASREAPGARRYNPQGPSLADLARQRVAAPPASQPPAPSPATEPGTPQAAATPVATPAPTASSPAATPPDRSPASPSPLKPEPQPAAPIRHAAAPPPPPRPQPVSAPDAGLASVAALVGTLADSPVASSPSKPAAKATPAKQPPKKEAPKTEAAKKPPPPKEPSRHWVQVAGGADKAAMNREYARLKGKAPKLLSARAAWTTPLKATNRLLVGPFKTSDEAQDFVNRLSEVGLAAFAWTSPDGQPVTKLGGK